MPTVLITGANRGLGLGLTRVYLEDGWNVIAAGRAASPELENLACDHLDIRSCDLTDDEALAALADSLSESTIDVLINNAGMMATGGFDDDVDKFGQFDRELWRKVFDINLFTPMRMAELFIDHIAGSTRGRMVTISSMLGSMELNNFGSLYAYRASKAGVNAIMKSMAIDLADRGVITIAMHPGWVQTDMGGAGAAIDVTTSVTGMKAVIDKLTPESSGKFLSYDGSEMPW